MFPQKKTGEQECRTELKSSSLLLSRVFLAQIPHRIPHRKEAHHNYCSKDDYHIPHSHTHRIGIYDITALATAKANETKLLLEQAERQSEHNANHSPQETNHSSFYHEDVTNLLLACPHIAQCHSILLLLNNEHGERANDIETSNHEDESQEDVGDEFFYLHDFKRILLLLIAV